MEAVLKFNSAEPVDMEAYRHAPKGYLYVRLIEEFVQVLERDERDGPRSDTRLVEKYAKDLCRISTKHGLPEVRQLIHSRLPGLEA